MTEECFEKLFWELVTPEICHHHSVNAIFNVPFVEDCKDKFKSQSFPGIVERNKIALVPCSVVNSNHHVHGPDLYGSCLIELE